MMLNKICHPVGALKQIDITEFDVHDYGRLLIKTHALTGAPFKIQPTQLQASNFNAKNSDSDRTLIKEIRASLDSRLIVPSNELSNIATQVAAYLKAFMTFYSLKKINVVTSNIAATHNVDSGQGFHYDKFANRMIIALQGPNLEWISADQLDAKNHQNLQRGANLDAPLELINKIPGNSVVFFKGDSLAHRRPVNSPERLLMIATEV